MSFKTVEDGFVDIGRRDAESLVDLPPHGLLHEENEQFFAALLDVIELLRIECLIRECHPLHEKLIELKMLIEKGKCQDYVPSTFPTSMTI